MGITCVSLGTLLTLATANRFEINDGAQVASSTLAAFPDTWFGLATAAAHVEAAYDGDPWVQFAKEGHVAAYRNEKTNPNPDQRLRFLEEPETEIDLAAAALGAGADSVMQPNAGPVFRMGVEWGRLQPKHPGEGGEGVQDREAMKQYRKIVEQVRAKGMRVMMTLFHHAMPPWSAKEGGWENSATPDHWLKFAKDVALELHDVVDFWVTFNEPHVFALLTYCAGLWPPGPVKSISDSLMCLKPAVPGVSADKGYIAVMRKMEGVHKEFYTWAHAAESTLTSKKIGVAHNVAHNVAYHFGGDTLTVAVTEQLLKFGFVDGIKTHIDFLGVNYYGEEKLKGGAPAIVDDMEYSESGRAIDPDGLLLVLLQFHNRYNDDSAAKFTSYIVTENGISDSTDILRPSYIIEHLLAIREAQRSGVPVEGYVHWTISDNWEWADGYCPKFGLVAVDRSAPDLARTKRNSYKLFSDIARTKVVTVDQRDTAWELVRNAALHREARPFCRAPDGKTGLDESMPRPFSQADWRFSKLSHGEGDACYETPWSAEGMSVSPDGQCMTLNSAFPAAVTLKRSKRQIVPKLFAWKSPHSDAPEHKATVCLGNPLVVAKKGEGLGSDHCCCIGKTCGFHHKPKLDLDMLHPCPEGFAHLPDDHDDCIAAR